MLGRQLCVKQVGIYYYYAEAGSNDAVSRSLASRVSIDQDEFQAFLAENKKLMDRYEELLDKLAQVSKLNEELEGKLKTTQQKLREYETMLTRTTTETDQTLRSAREKMSQLLEQSQRVLGQSA